MTPLRSRDATAAPEQGTLPPGVTPVPSEETRVVPLYKVEYPPTQRIQHLIVEHLGFLPISFIDEIINAANDAIYRATDALTKFVEAEQGAGEVTNEAMHQLETLLEHSADKNFDKFELYALRNFFNIPKELEDWLVLPHHPDPHAHADEELDEDIEVQADSKLAELRQRLLTQRLLRQRLQQQLKWADERATELSAVRKKLMPVIEALESGQGEALDSAFAKNQEQASEIEQLVNSVIEGSRDRNLLTALKAPDTRQVYLQRMAELASERLCSKQ
ncbi:hypothetical protein EV182_003619 [Spiromyces aspiralis]|uniref:Uncharacterized protein n=1 Tax=Spiromyces aspiralis TaxID=68401 RepID=A0ACC1HSA8_9FUNG|nr:hypothetical protein EV182_003619 [Spiromyces aspiralis]